MGVAGAAVFGEVQQRGHPGGGAGEFRSPVGDVDTLAATLLELRFTRS
ncbi:hypothetical protein [Streptomyces sp. SS1-1]|nr:hypothetical protein [Streptomyces sp. SS1-1]